MCSNILDIDKYLKYLKITLADADKAEIKLQNDALKLDKGFLSKISEEQSKKFWLAVKDKIDKEKEYLQVDIAPCYITSDID